MTEEILYCDYCGAVNKPSAVTCEDCGKRLRRNHSAFMVFLKTNTKAKLLDKAKDQFFDRIKDFLLSHLYGTVVTILVVTTVVAHAVPNGIRTDRFVCPYGEEIEIGEPVVTELTQEDKNIMFEKLYQYRILCDEALAGDMGAEITMSFSDILVNDAVEEFPHFGVHDLLSTGIHAYAQQNQPAGKYATSGTQSTPPVVNEELTSDFGKMLRDSGYEVAETIFSGIGYFDGRVYDFSNFDQMSPDFRFDFCVVYVKVNGEWYIAEDRRI